MTMSNRRKMTHQNPLVIESRQPRVKTGVPPRFQERDGDNLTFPDRLLLLLILTVYIDKKNSFYINIKSFKKVR